MCTEIECCCVVDVDFIFVVLVVQLIEEIVTVSLFCLF